MHIPDTFIPLPRLHCPPEFWPALGYHGTARFVAVGYEQHDDGRTAAGGAASDYLAFRLLLYANHLDMMAFDFGSDDALAEHLLVLDRGEAFDQAAVAGYIAAAENARQFVAQQWPPLPESDVPIDWSLLQAALRDSLSERPVQLATVVTSQRQQRLAALANALGLKE